MRDGEDNWGIKELQEAILSIAQYYDTLCEENNIDYCLMGGSALGAIRHNGFIPWDDDLDVFMRPQEYEKFREVFNRKGDKNTYYLQEWGGNKNITFAKLRLNKTHFVEPDLEKLNVHKGIFIDIFILHSCPNKKWAHWRQYIWSRYLVLKSLANRDYKRRGIWGNIILKPLKWLPKRAMVDYAIRQIYAAQNKTTEYYCHYLGRAGYKKGLYKRKYFEKTKRVPFETITLKVPYEVEEYLKDRWGDYRKLPSENEIKYFQHATNWSTEHPFFGYNPEGIYPDEKDLIV